MEYLIGGAVGMVIMAIPCLYLCFYIASKGADIFADLQNWINGLDDASIDGNRIYYRNRAGVIKPFMLPAVFDSIRNMDLRYTHAARKAHAKKVWMKHAR